MQSEIRELTSDELDQASGGCPKDTDYSFYDLILDLVGGIFGAEIGAEDAQ